MDESQNINISHTVAHYLIAIYELLEERGYARNADIAKQLGRTRGSVSITLRHMAKRNLVEFDENRFVRLTDLGVQLTHQCLGAKRAVSTFFQRVLGVTKHVALKDACKIEHQLSRETIQGLITFLKKYPMNQKRPVTKLP